jgi:hypothetical protein
MVLRFQALQTADRSGTGQGSQVQRKSGISSECFLQVASHTDVFRRRFSWPDTSEDPDPAQPCPALRMFVAWILNVA